MIPTGKRKSAAVSLTAAVLITCYLAQTIDCYRLKKTGRREGRKEAEATKTIRFQEGDIVFGRVFESGSGLKAQVVDGTRQSSSNASVEEDATYQADSAGWSKGHAQDASSKEASWKRMAPSLQCGGDQLKFRAVGPGASQFAVEGKASSVPLSQVPSNCGYNMQRNSLALVMIVPFDGCNMVQEGGSYVLPMRWQGIPVSLWCPKPAAPIVTTAAPHHQMNPEMPQVPQHPFFPPFHQYFSPPLPVTTAAPTLTTTAKKPEMPKFPQNPFYPPFYPMFPHPLPVTTAGPTTTSAKPPATQSPIFPFPFFPPYVPPFPYFPPPATDAAATTAKPQPQYPPFLPTYPFFPPPFPPYPYYPTPKPETTTPTTTTTKKPDLVLTPSPSHSHPHSHILPFMPYLPPYPPPYLFPPHVPKLG